MFRMLNSMSKEAKNAEEFTKSIEARQVQEVKKVPALSAQSTIFQPAHENIEKLKKRLDTAIANIIYKLEDSKSFELTNTTTSQWVNHKVHDESDPYKLHHFQKVLENEIKKLNSQLHKNGGKFTAVFFVFIAAWIKLAEYCFNQRNQARRDLLNLVGSASKSSLEWKVRFDDSRFGEPSLWEEKQTILNIISLLSIATLIIITIKQQNSTKKQISLLQEINSHVKDAVKYQTNIIELAKTKQQPIKNVLDFSSTECELQLIVSNSSSKLKPN